MLCPSLTKSTSNKKKIKNKEHSAHVVFRPLFKITTLRSNDLPSPRAKIAMLYEYVAVQKNATMYVRMSRTRRVTGNSTVILKCNNVECMSNWLFGLNVSVFFFGGYKSRDISSSWEESPQPAKLQKIPKKRYWRRGMTSAILCFQNLVRHRRMTLVVLCSPKRWKFRLCLCERLTSHQGCSYRW
jgi:hypothetical protein